ncbi:MAG TPA: DNA-processing protein DprA [Flavobacterium sp.]|nr:DNA-processing protein DprA [Flavobacterium sp.]
MRHSELLALLALQNVEGVGDVIAKKLISHCGSAEEVFRAKSSTLSRIDGVGPSLAAKIRNKPPLVQAEREAAFIEKNAISVLPYYDEHYPDRLKHCLDGPLLLFGSGVTTLRNRHVISIVGTRQITPYGVDCCKRLIADLAPLDPVIVSGFAYGVDIVAHQAALEHGLQTIGVLAHGLDRIYPAAHRKYWEKMKVTGGFLTEFRSGNDPERENFVKRNRIVAGISEATIVIESAEKGGSLITANLANDYNRDVFAVPGRITDKYSQGCNLLIKTQRAHALTSAADLIYLLGWDVAAAPKPVQKQLFVTLEGDEKTVYDFLAGNGKELLDIIALECGFPIHKTSSLLLGMELKGVVRPLPGKLFEAV